MNKYIKNIYKLAIINKFRKKTSWAPIHKKPSRVESENESGSSHSVASADGFFYVLQMMVQPPLSLQEGTPAQGIRHTNLSSVKAPVCILL